MLRNSRAIQAGSLGEETEHRPDLWLRGQWQRRGVGLLMDEAPLSRARASGAWRGEHKGRPG